MKTTLLRTTSTIRLPSWRYLPRDINGICTKHVRHASSKSKSSHPTPSISSATKTSRSDLPLPTHKKTSNLTTKSTGPVVPRSQEHHIGHENSSAQPGPIPIRSNVGAVRPSSASRTASGIVKSGLIRQTQTESDYIISPGDSQTLKLPDGRILGYGVYGSKSRKAQVVVSLHGTPGTRLNAGGLNSVGEYLDLTFVSPERPGYGLSTLKPKYTLLDHAEDVRTLMKSLCVPRYKTHAVSGGCAYAIALSHIAPKSELLGTVLVAPGSPPESPRVGERIGSFVFSLRSYLWPRRAANLMSKEIREWSIADSKDTRTNAELRKTSKGSQDLVHRAQYNAVHAWVADYAASDRYWGFELEAVDSNRIVIFAGGMDHHTPLTGVRYLRNRLKNCELQESPADDHKSLQRDYGHRSFQVVKTM